MNRLKRIWSNIKMFFAKHSVLRFVTKFFAGFLIFIIVLSLFTYGSLEVFCRPKTIEPNDQKTPPIISKDNVRSGVSTYLTYPEWSIVYSSDEYGQFLAKNKPSSFPYFGSIGQYWSNYCQVFAITKAKGEFNAGDHLMLLVIGYSYSAELAIKGVYENTVGRVTELFGKYPATDEDKYADYIANDYVNFVRLRPWYEYNYSKALGGLWVDTSLFGRNFPRKFERKTVLSLEYLFKSVYAKLIGFGSHSIYGIESTETYVVADNVNPGIFTKYPDIKNIKQLARNQYIISIPRYQPFTDLAPKIAADGVQFQEVAGNDEIFITTIIDRNVNYSPQSGDKVFETNILTDGNKKRIGVSVPVKSLTSDLGQLSSLHATIEHIYDY